MWLDLWYDFLKIWIVFLIANRIKSDDKLIQAEGVDSLSEAELREDCRERGMLGTLSVEEMRQQVILTFLWQANL